MGNALDWAALPVVLELIGPADPECVIYQLTVIRDRLRERSDT